jgi:hypothetical protein
MLADHQSTDDLRPADDLGVALPVPEVIAVDCPTVAVA